MSKVEVISAALLILISVCNALSAHYSTKTGLVKALLFVAELLSFMRSRGVSGLLKLPLQSVPPGSAAVPPYMLLPVLLVVVGCSMTPTQRLEKVFQAAQAAGSVSAPGFRALCGSLATSCTGQGITDPKLCPKYQTCFQARRAVNAALTAVHVAVVEGLGLAALGSKDSALVKLDLALRSLDEAWRILKESGAVRNVASLFDPEVK
jgi:hypothetical protein